MTASKPASGQAPTRLVAMAPTGVLGSSVLEDGRQSAAAAEIGRGAARLLLALGFASLPEVSLANGRRADLLAAAGRARSGSWK